jgi:tagatose-6-phosphate ketose/aldose isomerase
MLKLGIDETELSASGGLWTAREIVQQPAMLRATHDLVREQRLALDAFLTPLTGNPQTRIILTGAGTSAFIGECLAPLLNAQLSARVEAIPTTDIVSAPSLYLEPETPTLLVSFGRSGNSPESIAAVEIANEQVRNVHHLIITCNAEGALAKEASANTCILLLPEETHDRSFAMTSSFTSMTYAALEALSSGSADIDAIARSMHSVISDHAVRMKNLAAKGFDRVVYLGSGVFKGLAREAALKLMELTDGQIVTAFDTSLGFRHGPKTIVTEKSLIMMFVSNDPLTRAYDLDLLAELHDDGKAGSVIALSAQAGIADAISVPGLVCATDFSLLFPFIALPQMFAFYASLAAGLTPDNPNVSGTVNRVVQGVRIHSLELA